MKTICSILFINLVFLTGLFAQEKIYTTEYQVEYDVSYVKNLETPDETDEFVLYLFTGSEYGVLMNYNTLNEDEIKEDLKRQFERGQTHIESKSQPAGFFDKTFYKDLKTGDVESVSSVGKNQYITTIPKSFSDWKLEDESKEFGNYTVHKATTRYSGRDYVAWFTLEIPIPDGPYVFSGLPGLIVELYDTQNHFHFKLGSFKQLEEPRDWILPDLKHLTNKELEKARQNEADLMIREFTNPEEGTSIVVSVNGKELDAAEIKKMLKRDDSHLNKMELED